MSTSPPKKFDHLWHDAIEVAYAEVQRHGRLAVGHFKELRRNVYRFAAGIAQLQKHWQREMIEMIKSEGRTVQQWMDEHFEIIEAMGETRERIYAAIEAGTTEREYVEQGELAVINKRRVKNTAVKDDGVIPTPKTAFATDKDKAEHFVDLYQSMVSKYQCTKKELADARRDLGVTMARVRKMERTIERLKKDIERFYEDKTLVTTDN